MIVEHNFHYLSLKTWGGDCHQAMKEEILARPTDKNIIYQWVMITLVSKPKYQPQ